VEHHPGRSTLGGQDAGGHRVGDVLIHEALTAVVDVDAGLRREPGLPVVVALEVRRDQQQAEASPDQTRAYGVGEPDVVAATALAGHDEQAVPGGERVREVPAHQVRVTGQSACGHHDGVRAHLDAVRHHAGDPTLFVQQ